MFSCYCVCSFTKVKLCLHGLKKENHLMQLNCCLLFIWITCCAFICTMPEYSIQQTQPKK